MTSRLHTHPPPTLPTPAPSTTTAAPTPRIGPQHFDLLKLIGEGAFGKVILVRNRLNKSLYAMKAISKKLLRKKNNMQYMKSERDILTKVRHPFIVTLFFAFQTEQRLFLVMDFLAGGELFFHLKRRACTWPKWCWPSSFCTPWARAISCGLSANTRGRNGTFAGTHHLDD